MQSLLDDLPGLFYRQCASVALLSHHLLVDSVYVECEGPTLFSFSFFFKDFIYLFIETEREAETQAEGEAGIIQRA